MLKRSPSLSLILFLILLLFNIIFFSKLMFIDCFESFSNDSYLFKKNNDKNNFDSSAISFNSYRKNIAYESPTNLEKYYFLIRKGKIKNENIINSLFAYSTDSLMKYEFDSLVYNPDVIKELIFWVEEFKYYKKNDTASFSIIYPSIYDYWMNKIGSCVIQASEKNSDLKYDKKFNFIVNQLECKKYSIGIKFSNFEKLIDNITKSKWYYIFNRLMIETSILVKVLMSIFLIITFFSYIYLFKTITLKIKSKTKKK